MTPSQQAVRRERWARWGRVAAPVLLPLAAVLVLWAATQPWAVSHIGYGVSGPLSLPGRFHIAGRAYLAGDGLCRRRAEVEGLYGAPLHQMGVLLSFIGLPRAIMGIAVRRGTTPTVLFVRRGADCYLSYGLSGGP